MSDKAEEDPLTSRLLPHPLLQLNNNKSISDIHPPPLITEEEFKESPLKQRLLDDNRFEMQDLSSSRTPSNLPILLGGASQVSPNLADRIREHNPFGGPRRSNTPLFERQGSSQHNSQLGISLRRDSISGAAGLNLVGIGANKNMTANNIQNQSMKKQEQVRQKKLSRKIFFYNILENLLLFVLLLNSVVYPSASSAVYFVYALGMTALSMAKEEKKAKLKLILAIGFIIISFGLLATKGVYLILLNKDGELILTIDQRLLYDSLGIKIEQNTVKIQFYNTMMTVFFDGLTCIISILLAATYSSHRRDSIKKQSEEENTQYLLHPYFERHQESLCMFALLTLAASTIFVQTIFQAFILVVLALLFAAWAYDEHDKNSLRQMILIFALSTMILQLTITFIFQIAYVKYEIVGTDASIIWDMFGFQLHNLKTYQVILHLITMTLSIQAIQLYRTTRTSSIINIGFIPLNQDPPELDNDRKSYDNFAKSVFRSKGFGATSERSKTITSGAQFMKGGIAKYSIADKMKERTMEKKRKAQEEQQAFDQVMNIKEFSPQIFLIICRIVAFIWCYAYHDFQSWIMLAWIMHSTLFKSMKRFFRLTVTYYMPIFTLSFVFYYVINIPQVVEFSGMQANFDTWLTLGFYKFQIPPLEVLAMMLCLAPFFFLIKCKKYLNSDREKQKQKFLEKLVRKDSSTLYHILFALITNLDMIVFIAIFFSGVNKIDFYHIFLMFFFVAYIMAPAWFKRNYIYLLYYVDFFVFEKYLYTLVMHYLPPNSQIQQFLDVFGLSTDYSELSKTQYFRYPPKVQQWILIVVVFIQFQVHKLLQNEQNVEKYSEIVTANFKERFPRLSHFWELLQHLKKEFLILITFIIFFVIIIFSDKNIINWGFQIIICIFIITYVGVKNHVIQDNGINRLQRVWFLIIWYSAFVLIVQIVFQFAALPYVRKSLDLDFILNLLPLWIRKNLALIGFQVYTTYIWQKFLVYLMYFAIGVYVQEQMIIWHIIEKNSKNIEMLPGEGIVNANINVSINSDMQEDYIQDKARINWKKEYMKIRFTTPYLVYKLRKLWFIVDKCSQLIFVFISLMIMILATSWQISLSMAIHLTCFIGLCLQIASRLYKNRKGEKKALSNRNQNGEKYRRELEIEECEKHWQKYKRVVNQHQVKIRQKVWFFQFVITLLCIALIYPSEFIFYVRQTFFEQKDQQELVALLDYITFYLFWVGVYHSPKSVSNHGYFYNLYGYLIILVLLVFEKNAQQWALNRFGCTTELVQWYSEIETNLNKKQISESKTLPKPSIVDQVIKEEQEHEDEDSIDTRKLKQKSMILDSYLQKSERSLIKSYQNESNFQEEEFKSEFSGVRIKSEEELKNELKNWVQKKYMLKLLNGFKILLEETIQLLLLISSVYKDSVIGMVLLFGIFLFLVRKKIKTIARLAWITGISMIVQYGLALSNLNTDNNPMDFPFPFNPYPSNPQDEGEFVIPWYRKIPLLKDSFPWQVYLSMGVSNVKLNTIWIDYVIMGCIQASLFYFGCQLFSIDLKVKRSDLLTEHFNKYFMMVAGNCSPETVKKETKKLKRQVFAFNFYKGAQLAIFLHFHQITIVVTLLLAILARSLVSFGYIAVCLVMIYENHKFFRPEQKNFQLQRVLKYWVQPYVFVDITLQLIFQIPINYLHDGQDEPSSWQNIIGLQDIWTEDPANINEVTANSITYIILKAFTFYFVTLQIQIFDSRAYKHYIKKDFKAYISMAQTKGQAIMWRYNNQKIDKIKEQQREKNKMDDLLSNLKKVLTKWQSHTNQDLDEKMQVAFDNDIPKENGFKNGKGIKSHFKNRLEAISQDDQKITPEGSKMGSFLIDDKESSHQDYKRSNSMRKQSLRRSGNVSFAEKGNRSSFLPDISEEDEHTVNKDDADYLERVKRKLPALVKLLIWIKKTATDQIIFISSKNYLNKVVLDMQAGKINILTKMERRMLSDIKDYKRKRPRSDPKDIEIKDMKRTSQFIGFGKMLHAYFRLLIEILVTYSDSVCYILMIVSMMKNAGLISILYPMMVFGYALMEEINPKKRVWYILMIYTEILIMTKFIFQLSFWDAFFNPSQMSHFQDSLNGIHVGLIRVASDAFGKMVSYFLPEILILLGIMAHIQKEIMTGIIDIKETIQEGIEEALIRYVKSNSQNSVVRKSLKSQSILTGTVGNQLSLKQSQLNENQEFFADLEDLNVFDVKFKKDVAEYNKNYKRMSFTQDTYDALEAYEPIEIDEQYLQIIGQDGVRRPRAYSLLQQKDLNKFLKYAQQRELLEKLDLENQKNKVLKNKIIGRIQGFFYKNQYFEKLFPSIKEQKPGKDLYAVIATFQFLICIFMIFFYTKMDADVTNISESLTYNQFSGQMVIALFLQILVMIIDRYLYKSKTFIQTAENTGFKKPYRNNNIDQKGIKSDKTNDDPISVLKSIKKQRETRDVNKVIAQMDDATDSSILDQHELQDNVVLENTKITLAMVSKYYLQIFLLLFVHAFVFWYFPITGNLKLQNNPFCVTKSSTVQTTDKINCNEFGENWALVFFYILYCAYFWVSALQIRFGVSEIKKSHFLMNSYHIVNYVAFKGFMAIPFLFELKTFVDWTFTRTALDVFQWFILSATHAELYIAHSLQGRYQRKPLGKPVQSILKVILGGCGQFGIIMLIAGPLLLFSTFNPISTPDPVINAQIQFNILIEPQGSLARNTINLFTNNYVTTLKTVTEIQYDIMHFSNDPKTKSFDRDLIQFIKMNSNPDTSWSVSQPNREYLKREFDKSINNESSSNLFFQLSYYFDREKQSIAAAHNQVLYDLKEPIFRPALKNFTDTFNLNCQGGQSNATSIINIPQIFTGVHFLNDDESAINSTNEMWMKGLQIFYSCKDYWTVDQLLIQKNTSFPESNLPSSQIPGIAFFTFSSKTAPSYFRYSVLTFYLSIVLVIGKLIRGVLVIGGNRIFIFEIPRAEPLLQLCECVYIYRMRSQLDKEEQLYFTFIDIMRSPEMIKAITGSSMKKKTQ